ncbi:MAG: hypothetical protein FJX75_07225 [Armatimonadetes bacterium]|nr:hypothetical protein [Armatimonadota bacterium]
MLAYLEQAMFNLMGYPLLMLIWVALTSMLYLLQVRAHRFRTRGTMRLFVTAAIMGVVIPGVSYVLGWIIDLNLDGTAQRVLAILAGPFLIILAFALAVTLIQRFLGADAETALRWAWVITVITYVIPIAFCFILSVFHQGWLTGQEQLY